MSYPFGDNARMKMTSPIHQSTNPSIQSSLQPLNSQLSTLLPAWRGLESLSGLRAIPSVWRRRLGEHFDSLRPFLQATQERAAGFFCDRCCCIHEVIPQPPELLAALTAGMTPTTLH